MQLEMELRRILGLRDEVNFNQEKVKHFSARSLFSQFVERYPAYREVQSSFDYVLQICNAAIHGRLISVAYAHEALFMGFNILNELKSINGKGHLPNTE